MNSLFELLVFEVSVCNEWTLLFEAGTEQHITVRLQEKQSHCFTRGQKKKESQCSIVSFAHQRDVSIKD